MTRIYLLGRVMIETADAVIEASAFPGRQGRLAFVYLASAPRRVERHELADVVWHHELPPAWDSSLSAIVSKLRRLIGRAGLDAAGGLETRHGAHELRLPEGTWIDLRVAVNSLDRAEGAVRRGDGPTAWADATVASAILRRPFLPGETGPWVDSMRRELHEMQVRTYGTLAAAWLLSDDPRAAVHAARRSVDLAPYRESGYARLMECHLAGGNRAEAVRVYDEISTLLRETMGISPAEDVEALYLRALG